MSVATFRSTSRVAALEVVTKLAVVLPAQRRLHRERALGTEWLGADLLEAVLAVGLELLPAEGIFSGQRRGAGFGSERAAAELLGGEGFAPASGLGLQLQQPRL
jgi:hypothetical protein